MRYIVHVIDDASQHEKRESGEYRIAPGLTDDNSICDIMRTDGWYVLESNTPLDAVAILANTIEVKNTDGKIKVGWKDDTYIFSMESDGVYPFELVLKKTFEIFKEKIDEFNTKLEEIEI